MQFCGARSCWAWATGATSSSQTSRLAGGQPGLLFDPNWEYKDRVQAKHRLFPHALNMTDIVNDLSDDQLRD